MFFQAVSKVTKSTPKGKASSSDSGSSSSEDEKKPAKKGAKKAPVKSKKLVRNKFIHFNIFCLKEHSEFEQFQWAKSRDTNVCLILPQLLCMILTLA